MTLFYAILNLIIWFYQRYPTVLTVAGRAYATVLRLSPSSVRNALWLNGAS